MDIPNTPPVFKNFAVIDTASSGAKNNTVSAASAVSPNTNTAAQTDEVKIKKHHKPHPVLKVLIAAAAAVTAFSFAVPAIRHKSFPKVNPTVMDIGKKSQFTKKNFILFADQVEAKRNLTGTYIADRFKKVKEIIRRNFFSYNQEVPEELTPIRKFPQKLVSGILNEINEFADYLRKMTNQIEIDYSKIAKS